MRLQIDRNHPEPRKVRRAADELRAGKVIAYPTDTTYGIGCDLNARKSIDAIYAAKRMPRDKPLTLLCPDLSDIAKYALVEKVSYRLMRRLVPGPYCFILPASRDVPRMMVMKRKTIGIRVPDHAVTQALLRELGAPIVSTTASWEGQILQDPDEIDEQFAGLGLVVDDGYGGASPSTIVDLSGDTPKILREGAGSIEELYL